MEEQPRLGLSGLLLVVPIAVLLAVGYGGPVDSAVVLGPLLAFCLPLVALLGFWWEDWPGTRLEPRLSGWADTVLIGVGGLVLAAGGQALAGGLDVRSLLVPGAQPGGVPLDPATLSLSGLAFVATLQITLVGEKRPLHRLPPRLGGVVAVGVCVLLAVVLYVSVIEVRSPPGSGVVERSGPLGPWLGAALLVLGAWQVLVCVVWRGWPLAGITAPNLRVLARHVTVLAGAAGSYVVGREVVGLPLAQLSAGAACLSAAGLVVGMLFEGRSDRSPLRGLSLTAIAALVLGLGLRAVSGLLGLGEESLGWIVHASLNALGLSTILHVAIGRRWPFARARAAPGP